MIGRRGSDDVPCPRCAGPSDVWVRARDRRDGIAHAVRRCLRCRIGFTWPVLPDAPAAPTALPAGGVLRRAADALTRAELGPVRSAVEPGGSLLDIGAGGGNRALVLARTGFRVRAVEPDPVEAAHARAQLDGLAEVREQPIETLPPADAGYDGAVLSHVLEHLDDPEATLAATLMRLRPGGRIVVMVPNAGGVEARVFGGRWHGWEPARHRWHYTRATLAQSLVQAGYADIDVRARGGWRYPATLAFSLSPRLDPQIPGAPHHLVGRLLALALAPVAALEVLAGRGPQLVATARRPLGSAE